MTFSTEFQTNDKKVGYAYLKDKLHLGVFDPKITYRNEQNWLSSGGRGALGVSYVPPSPECLEELMQAFLKMANSLPK